jgi:hypothetical protein
MGALMSFDRPGCGRRDAAATSTLVSRFLLALAITAVLGARASQAQPASPAAPSGPPPATATGSSEDSPDHNVMDDLEATEPPDGKWIKEGEDREYFITRLKKVRGTYDRLSPHEILYKRFHHLEIDHEDDQYFYVRYYRATEAAVKRVDDTYREQEASLARLKDAYKFDERTVDRLTFAPFDQGLPHRGQWRQGLAIADMNGDGFLDIVHGPPRKGATMPQIFLGNGAGAWRLWSEASWPREQLDYGDIAVGDVDGDGRPDLALGVHLRGLRVLVQSEPGRFVDASKGLPYDIPGKGGDASGFSSRAVRFADWNGDHRLDLVALGEGPRQQRTVDGKTEGIPLSSSFGLVVYLNEGSEGWRSLSSGAVRGVFGDSLAVGDLNADSHPDTATVSYTLGNRHIVYLNDVESGEGWKSEEIDTLRARAWVFGVTVGDFDEDGHDDLVTSFATHDGDAQRRGLELSRRNAKGVWETRLIAAYENMDNMWSVVSGDLDGDGHRDLAASTELGNMLVFLGDGKGGFAREESPEIDPPTLCRGYGLQMVDLDHDGRAELVAAFAGEAETILEFLGTTKCVSGGALRVWRSTLRPPS